MHQIDIQVKRKNVEPHESDHESKRMKITTIDNFINDSTLSAVLARMTYGIHLFERIKHDFSQKIKQWDSA